MEIRIIPTELDGAVIVETEFVQDERGFLIETYHRRHYAEHGIDLEFVQENHSKSARNVVRGLHYQDLTAPMAKLARCTAAVDLRPATFRRSDLQTF